MKWQLRSLFLTFVLLTIFQNVVFCETVKKEKVLINPLELTIEQVCKPLDSMKIGSSYYVRLDDLCNALNYRVIKNKSGIIIKTEQSSKDNAKGVSVFKGLKNKSIQSLSINKFSQLLSINSQNYHIPIALYQNVDFVDLTKFSECINIKFSINPSGKLQIKNPIHSIFPSTTLRTNKPVIVTVTGYAALIEYRINNENWTKYSMPFNIKENCKIDVRYKNKFGIILDSLSSEIVNIDYVAPQKPEIICNTTDSVKDFLEISINSKSKDVDKIEYMLYENDTWFTYKAPIYVSANMNFFARAVDKAGNISEMSEIKINNILTKKSTEQIKNLSSSVVKIKSYNYNGLQVKTGTGFLVNDRGSIVTNYYTINLASRIEVITSDGKVYNVSGVQGFDIDKDMAVLKVNDPLSISPLNIDYNDDYAINDFVAVLTNPMDDKKPFSYLSVMNKDLHIRSPKYLDINIGYSEELRNNGSPICNIYGEVIGIADKYITDKMNYFMIPISDAKDMISNTTQIMTMEEAFRSELKSIDNQDPSKKILIKLDYLSNYSQENVDGYAFDTYSLGIYEQNDTDKSIMVSIICTIEQGKEYERCLKDNKQALIEAWMDKIMKEIKHMYPNKKIIFDLFKEAVYDPNTPAISDDLMDAVSRKGEKVSRLVFVQYICDQNTNKFIWIQR